jgi:nuclease S1
MPLHVGDDYHRGGNDIQIRFFDRGSNMHRLWDSDMIAREGDTEEYWLGELSALDTAENRAAWMGGDVEAWATESLLAARTAYLVPGAGTGLNPGQKLGEEYVKANLPVVRQRLYQGGIRLAWVLNEALGPE